MAKRFAQPENINNLSPVAYKFAVQNLPNTNWMLTSVNLPGISLGEINHPTPFMQTQQAGNDLIFEALNVTFIVDEDLQNWREIFDWMNGLGFPDRFEQFKSWMGSNTEFSDASLIILNSNMNPNYRILFKDLFPTSISEVLFDSGSTDIEVIKATATFRYLTYKYEKV